MCTALCRYTLLQHWVSRHPALLQAWRDQATDEGRGGRRGGELEEVVAGGRQGGELEEVGGGRGGLEQLVGGGRRGGELEEVSSESGTVKLN